MVNPILGNEFCFAKQGDAISILLVTCLDNMLFIDSKFNSGLTSHLFKPLKSLIIVMPEWTTIVTETIPGCIKVLWIVHVVIVTNETCT